MKNIVITLLVLACVLLSGIVDASHKSLTAARKINVDQAVVNIERSGDYQKALQSLERLQLDAFIASENSNRMQINLDTLQSYHGQIVKWGFRALEYTGDHAQDLLNRMPNYPALQPMLTVTNWAVCPNIYIYIR